MTKLDDYLNEEPVDEEYLPYLGNLDRLENIEDQIHSIWQSLENTKGLLWAIIALLIIASFHFW